VPIKKGFIDKLIERIDKLDPESLQTQFLRLVQERGLLETIFQSIQEGVIVLDGVGKVTYANRAVENLVGISLEDSGGRKLQAFMNEVGGEGMLNSDGSEPSGLLTREIEVFYPEHRYISFYVVPLASVTAEESGGAVLILRDVTRDREQEASNIESEKVNAIKLLAAGVAHEIGNPLNALNIHLQLLQREMRSLSEDQPTEEREDGSTLEDMVSVCRTEVSRLDLIITQFLKAIRPTKPELSMVKIDELLKEVLTLMKHDVESRAISIGLSCPDTIPGISVDRDQIKQAFFNVVKNAMQAMKDGGCLEIAISTDRQFMRVSFSDDGGGIGPEDFAHIFDAYYTTSDKGSGLGLMIVQRIVQDHGGQISIKTEPKKGTEFVIMLPLVERQVRLLAQGNATKPVLDKEESK
jgi:two-component system, sporulation sensor kinase E